MGEKEVRQAYKNLTLKPHKTGKIPEYCLLCGVFHSCSSHKDMVARLKDAEAQLEYDKGCRVRREQWIQKMVNFTKRLEKENKQLRACFQAGCTSPEYNYGSSDEGIDVYYEGEHNH